MKLAPILEQFSELEPVFQGADHLDIKSASGAVSMRQFISGMLSYQPGWVTFLYGVRAVFVRFLGMRQERIPRRFSLKAEDIPMEVGQRIALFKVRLAEENRYWVAEAEAKHLKASLVVIAQPLQQYKVITVVHYHKWSGPVYFNVIRPFHHLVVGSMVRAGVKQHPPTTNNSPSLWQKVRRKVLGALIGSWKKRLLKKVSLEPEHLLGVARATMEREKYCWVLTCDKAAQINARLLQPSRPEKDMSLWFGTSASSRKVRELLEKGQISVAYNNNKQGAYVTLSGTASLENDIVIKQKYWRESWVAFWPGGPQSEDFTLIKFEPSRIELMNFARKVTPEPFGLQPAVLVRTNQSWELEGELAERQLAIR